MMDLEGTGEAKSHHHCPYIGLADDAATHTNYPSSLNCCHKVKPQEGVHEAHQRAACLTDAYEKCPVYQQTQKGALPKVLRFEANSPARKRLSAGRWLGVLTAATTVMISMVYLIRATLIIPITGIKGDGSQPSAANNEEIRMPVVMRSPTQDFESPEKGNETATITPILTIETGEMYSAGGTPEMEMKGRKLDVPIGRREKFVIHRVQSGENLSQYAAQYNTTVEAIIRVNYELMIPLWVDSLLVIPIDCSDATEMPYFQPYKISENGMRASDIAADLDVNVEDFLKFNDLYSTQVLNYGDWVIIPRSQPADLSRSATAIPDVEPTR